MVLPGVIFLLAFTFVPLIYSVIAFQKFNPALGIQNSPWVGLNNFTLLFRIPDARIVFKNTLFIATMKIIMLECVAIIFALLLNEIHFERTKKAIQTMVYLPHFLSWVILAGILRTILAPRWIAQRFSGFVRYYAGVFPW